MYGIFTYIFPKNCPNVGKYSSTMEHMGMCPIKHENFRPFLISRRSVTVTNSPEMDLQ